MKVRSCGGADRAWIQGARLERTPQAYSTVRLRSLNGMRKMRHVDMPVSAAAARSFMNNPG